jgi:hypothetical protein
VVIAESLRSDAQLDCGLINIASVRRVAVEGAADGQPSIWTLLEFTADDAQAEALAGQLAAALNTSGAWYVDFHSDEQSFVVFAERIFRYRRATPMAVVKSSIMPALSASRTPNWTGPGSLLPGSCADRRSTMRSRRCCTSSTGTGACVCYGSWSSTTPAD